MDDVLVVARLGLAAVFLVAGVAKLLDLTGSRRALTEFGVPTSLVAAGAVLLPLAELATALALVFAPTAGWGAVAALVLLAAFVFGLTRALRRGQAPSCHCFGQLHSEPASKATVIRNAVLMLPALAVAVDPGPALDAWVDARDAQELVLVATTTVTLALIGVTALLWRELARLRRRIPEPVPEWVPPEPLAVGEQAPAFSALRPDGDPLTLEELLRPGLPCVLTFVQPGCGPCGDLMPDLARWQQSLAAELALPVVTYGDREEARRLTEEHGLRDVMSQNAGDISSAYKVYATPCAVLISAEGTIGSGVASGLPAIEALVRVALHRDDAAAGLVVHQVA